MRRWTAIAVAAVTLALVPLASAGGGTLTPHQKLERAVDVVVTCVPGAGSTFTYTVGPFRMLIPDTACDGVFRSMMADPPVGPAQPLDAAVIQGWAGVATVYAAITCVKFGVGCSEIADDPAYRVNAPNVLPRLLDDVGIKGKYKRQLRREVERATWGTP